MFIQRAWPSDWGHPHLTLTVDLENCAQTGLFFRLLFLLITSYFCKLRDANCLRTNKKCASPEASSSPITEHNRSQVVFPIDANAFLPVFADLTWIEMRINSQPVSLSDVQTVPKETRIYTDCGGWHGCDTPKPETLCTLLKFNTVAHRFVQDTGKVAKILPVITWGQKMPNHTNMVLQSNFRWVSVNSNVENLNSQIICKSHTKKSHYLGNANLPV